MTTDKTEGARGEPGDLFAVLEALKAAKGTRNEEVFKIEAIRVYARLGMTIPEELLPCLDDACDAWIKAQGNALRVGTTRIKNRLLVTEVCGLMDDGCTKKEAIAMIHEQFGVSETTALKYYKKHRDTRKYMEGLTKKRRL